VVHTLLRLICVNGRSRSVGSGIVTVTSSCNPPEGGRDSKQSRRRGAPTLPGTGVGGPSPGFGRQQRATSLQQVNGDAVRRVDEGHAAGRAAACPLATSSHCHPSLGLPETSPFGIGATEGALTGPQQAKCVVEAPTLPYEPSARKTVADIRPPLQTAVFQHFVQM
jgi:hypothetical protein